MATILTFLFFLVVFGTFCGCVLAFLFIDWLKEFRQRLLTRRFNRYVKKQFNGK